MKTTRCTVVVALLSAASRPAGAQSDGAAVPFADAAATVKQQLAESLAELGALRARIADEKIPLGRRMRELEAELVEVRAEYQQTLRSLDDQSLELSKLRDDNRHRQEEAGYLSNLLSEYLRNFEARLHIAEMQRYGEPLETARLAPANSRLSPRQIYRAQIDALAMSLDRLHEALGGTRFDGTAVEPGRTVVRGTFVLVGPAAVFCSAGERRAGTAEQRLGSLEPAQIEFADLEDAQAAAQLVTSGAGLFPLDPTLGNAHKVESTRETLVEHVRKGGPVMIPILTMAGLALLVALFKWIALALVRRPSQKQIGALLHVVGQHDVAAARQMVAAMRGPIGRMLDAGVEHIQEPHELIEEVMYETVLTTRLKLQRLLPFIAICAASAPLLGLLGTVTGIIDTFKMITVFGSGDVKTLSGGISEALITTEFGLIVAIPSLLLHAFLSRKARGVLDQMEKAAVSFVNQIGKTPFARNHGAMSRESRTGSAAPDPALVRAQVNEILRDLLEPLVEKNGGGDEDAATSRVLQRG